MNSPRKTPLKTATSTGDAANVKAAEQSARNLSEARNTLSLEPLPADASFYQDLSAARGTNCLARIEVRLREVAKASDAPYHLAFLGHRGSGKSTELLRLEEKLADCYYPIHLYLDSTLHRDADYPDILLWLVESIASKLKTDNVPLDSKLVDEVASWFARAVKTKETVSASTNAVSAEAKTTASVGIWGFGAKALASIKSNFVGSTKLRHEIRQELKKYATELIQAVNNFLAHVKKALSASGRPGRLLIVQDNLDRLDRDAALNLFRDSGEILKTLQAVFVWTPPVGSQLAPFNIGNIFDPFPMPNIGVFDRDGKQKRVAIQGLTALVSRRMIIKDTFKKPTLVRDLILSSGGSIRDLLRLIERSRLEALANSHEVIEPSDVKQAVKSFGIDFQTTLIPSNIYFPTLAEISIHKRFVADLKNDLADQTINERRAFFHQLIMEGAVLAYNGNETWYDVHPAIRNLREFKEAVKAATKSS